MNQQLALAIQLNDEAKLADFCWGNNLLLQQKLHDLMENKEDRPLYLWGNSGSGKSYLLQACCQAKNNTQSAIYLPLNILREWGPQVIDGIEGQALICIDDIEAIAKDPAWEEALFHLYNRTYDQQQTTLIIAGRYPPTNLAISLADLRSRLSWGLVLQLYELEDEDKIKTLQLQANKRGLKLPTPVGQFLLNRCARNMHDLHVLLDALDNASLSAQRKITIPFVKQILDL